MALSHRDWEIINLELTTIVQEMDEKIRNGHQYKPMTMEYLEEMRGTIAKVRRIMSPSSPRLQVVA